MRSLLLFLLGMVGGFGLSFVKKKKNRGLKVRVP